jgi:hypothetical protein
MHIISLMFFIISFNPYWTVFMFLFTDQPFFFWFFIEQCEQCQNAVFYHILEDITTTTVGDLSAMSMDALYSMLNFQWDEYFHNLSQAQMYAEHAKVAHKITEDICNVLTSQMDISDANSEKPELAVDTSVSSFQTTATAPYSA